MKRSKIVQFIFTTAMLIAVVDGMSQYNASPTLKIGDPAPAMKVQTWIRGTPVAQFEKGKVYVLDFWATWCGGCIASFPHISAIAEKYKGRVEFNSIDVYEAIDSSKVDPVTKVKEFLKTSRGQKLTFSVAVDGNDNSMWDPWIKTIRRNGVPTTFVIDQEGRIAWLDVNLDHLDWVLQQVLAGKWNREKAAAVMQMRDAIEDQLFAVFRKGEGEHRKEWETLLTAAEAFEKKFPDRTDAVAFYKFMALEVLDSKKIPALLEKMAADPLSRYIHLNDAAGLTLRRKDLTRTDYAAVAKVQERLLLNEYPGVGYGGKNVKAYEELADTYYKSGNTDRAVASMEKAIALTAKEKTPAEQIKKLNSLLLKYRSGGNGNS